jgi:hypothetical protein
VLEGPIPMLELLIRANVVSLVCMYNKHDEEEDAKYEATSKQKNEVLVLKKTSTSKEVAGGKLERYFTVKELWADTG